MHQLAQTYEVNSSPLRTVIKEKLLDVQRQLVPRLGVLLRPRKDQDLLNGEQKRAIGLQEMQKYLYDDVLRDLLERASPAARQFIKELLGDEDHLAAAKPKQARRARDREEKPTESTFFERMCQQCGPEGASLYAKIRD